MFGELIPVCLRITVSVIAIILDAHDELHHLFLIAKILRFVVRGAKIALLRDKEPDMLAQQGSHRLSFPVRFASKPFEFLFTEAYGDGVCAGQGMTS